MGTPKASAAAIRAYLASVPTRSRAPLRKLREAARAAAPTATESISYGIPTLKLDGRPLVYYAGWKQHVSIYPITSAIRRAFRRELEKHETSKGTLRFPIDKPVPTALVRRIVKVRVAELRGKGKR